MDVRSLSSVPLTAHNSQPCAFPLPSHILNPTSSGFPLILFRFPHACPGRSERHPEASLVCRVRLVGPRQPEDACPFRPKGNKALIGRPLLTCTDGELKSDYRTLHSPSPHRPTAQVQGPEDMAHFEAGQEVAHKLLGSGRHVSVGTFADF